MPAAKTVMTTAFRCTPKAKSRRVPSNKHRKAVAPPITLKAKSTQLSIMASAEGPEGNRHLMLLRWCPGQGSNLHDGITRRGILSRDFAINHRNRQTPTAYGSMGCLLCIAIDFRCLLHRLCQNCAGEGVAMDIEA